MGYKTLYLTNRMRSRLKEPFGRVFKDDDAELDKLLSERKGRLITVGDEVSKRFDADIKIFDGRTKRNIPVDISKWDYDYKLFNPPATIQKEAFETLEKVYASGKKCSILIDGEEDLLVIPSVMFGDYGDIVLYGLFGKGIGFVDVNPDVKNEIDKIKKEFRSEKFETVVVGGTFDKLHEGHEYILKMCGCYGNRIVVGITNDRMASIKDSRIKSYEIRRKNVENFLDYLGVDHRISEIDDVCGPAVNKGDAIVVTEESLCGAEKINDKRRNLGYNALEIIVLPYVLDEKGRKISSRDIRDGETLV